MAKILAIESSCDETACAIIEDGHVVLSNVVSTQIDTHKQFGGVVPEVASRLHVEKISIVIKEALEKAGMSVQDVDAIAYTKGPGLIGSLHVGVQAAKTLAWMYKKPMLPTNHMAGHIYANAFVKELKFPLLALVISGGHSQLVWMKEEYSFEIIGDTLDDAVGEAYDKVSRVLGTGYPGGPVIDKLAKQGKEHYFLKTPKTDGTYDFSFSGLKSSVLQLIQREEKLGNPLVKEDVAFAFQEVAIHSLVDKTVVAIRDKKPAMLVLAGGVSANSRLREVMVEKMQAFPETDLILPPLSVCMDNAAMIGAAAWVAWQRQEFGTWEDSADSSMELSV
ncbi:MULTISPECIES: tRNA (adenosine(37)-N6)-threonylcarbamoyltransferase complex transferase subunit TsaD [Terrabacteria group]|uniref:tRNA (adenosine(37)-N6)-threonylcarbamoyltransferase complex transferase subunit TsaD n=1 Tax=Bacillati TaxID=1783272 RepID=UPI001C6EBFCE|nr:MULTISPECIES: tRNA (adenosine(37)-N6)-threonylcarbamoyltransferase complex transferase subunit TsaD [Terrabacteria group]MBW9213169.1 tRNA (adenosine(37)-N6)-threonylcarbamoyltransferase complex transferase subunit TsaD [Trueperella sp. zg.1013]